MLVQVKKLVYIVLYAKHVITALLNTAFTRIMNCPPGKRLLYINNL